MVSKRDVDFYHLALRIAEDSDCSDKHGTVVVRGGAVLAVAANRFIGNPTSARWDKKTIHSEQRAILRLGLNARGTTMYTARLHTNRMSGPCVMCRALIHAAGVHMIIYHTQYGLIRERL